MHGISLLPIAQPGCKLEDTSTEAAPTQRQLGVYDGDPTIDLVLPPRSFLAVRPLTDDEIVVCRSFSLQTLTATRQPAAWALAEATARTSEIPHIVVSDLDSSIESGFPERFVTEQVGHAWGSTTSIYCSVSDDKNRVLQKAIASAFRRPGEGDKP